MKRRRSSLWLVIVLGVGVVVLLTLRTPEGERTSRSAVRVAHDTTRITDKLKPDGRPDYLWVLNDELRKGITTGSNAEVALRQILGPTAIPERLRERYYEMLGVPLPTIESGDYFTSFAEFVRSRATTDKSIAEELTESLNGPWNEEQYPALAEWLSGNEEHLNAAIEATRMSQMYVPLISDDPDFPLFAVLLPACQQHRELAQALTSRAMLRLGHGEMDEAWQDVMACHRLARHVSRASGFIVEAAMAQYIENLACEAGRTIATVSNMSASTARSMAEDLRQLPPMPDIARHFDRSGRFAFIETALSFAKYGPSIINRMSYHQSDSDSPVMNKASDVIAQSMVDWNEVLRLGNRFYDQFAEAARAKTAAERRAKEQAIERELAQLAGQPMSLVMARNSKERAQAMLAVLLQYHSPHISRILRARDASAAQMELSRLTFALVIYHAEHERYPVDLAALVPEYLPELAHDPLTGESFRYHRDAAMATLYSVGLNQRDDGGKSGKDDVQSDDIVVHLGL